MTDHFQILSIVAGAIRSCRSETPGRNGATAIDTEELNSIAKAIIRALAESSLHIVPVPKATGVGGDKPAA